MVFTFEIPYVSLSNCVGSPLEVGLYPSSHETTQVLAPKYLQKQTTKLVFPRVLLSNPRPNQTPSEPSVFVIQEAS